MNVWQRLIAIPVLTQRYSAPSTVSTEMLPKSRVTTYSRWPASMKLVTGNVKSIVMKERGNLWLCKYVQWGAATCREGIITYFLGVPQKLLGCTSADMLHKEASGTCRNHITEHFSWISAPDCKEDLLYSKFYSSATRLAPAPGPCIGSKPRWTGLQTSQTPRSTRSVTLRPAEPEELKTSHFRTGEDWAS